MLNETINSIFIYLIILVTTIGYGFIFSSIFFKKNISINLGEIGLFGFFVISFLAVFFHFFIPLNHIFNLSFILIGMILFIYFNFKEKFKLFNFKIYNMFCIARHSIFGMANNYIFCSNRFY